MRIQLSASIVSFVLVSGVTDAAQKNTPPAPANKEIRICDDRDREASIVACTKLIVFFEAAAAEPNKTAETSPRELLAEYVFDRGTAYWMTEGNRVGDGKKWRRNRLVLGCEDFKRALSLGYKATSSALDKRSLDSMTLYCTEPDKTIGILCKDGKCE
jgi:hypothetical protein